MQQSRITGKRYLVFLLGIFFLILSTPWVVLFTQMMVDLDGLKLYIFHILSIAFFWDVMIFASSLIFLGFIGAFISFVISSNSKNPAKLAINMSSKSGDIQISSNVIESLTLRTAKRMKDIKDVTAWVGFPRDNLKDGLKICLKVTVDGEGSLPELATKLQLSVKECIKNITGIDVSRVDVKFIKVAAVDHVAMYIES